jgi:nucleotide-binding universal stress UspA family protein
MNARPSILCPVDFSDASAGALRYAATIAARFHARLVVMSVDEPLVTEAVDLGTGIVWTPEDCRQEIVRFVNRTFDHEPAPQYPLEYEVAVGRPATEILRVSRERPCSLIVMSSHGLTGMRKLFFGSTTERVLRETSVPVLVTPLLDLGPRRLQDVKRLLGRMLVPVDLSAASAGQLKAASSIGDLFDLPLLVAHVIEPLRSPLAARLHLTGIEPDRRAAAEDRLADLMGVVPRDRHPESLVVYGDPAEELAKIARDRRAGLIVMGLHGSTMLGPRMGSVTYRLLCLATVLVLAIPPHQEPAAWIRADQSGQDVEDSENFSIR